MAVAGGLYGDILQAYVQGESTGGMVEGHFMQETPDAVADVVSWSGLPLLGYTFARTFGAVRTPKP